MNERPLKCQGRFKNVQVLLQGIPLIELDLVLDVYWLEQLGLMASNW